MTPKEKAKEIYTKIFDKFFSSYETDRLAKECAIIAVNEIIDEIIKIDSQMSETHLLDKNLKYWLEVNRQIMDL
jgi:hypothetical protein